MDALKKWMTIKFTPYETITKIDVLPKTFVQIIFAAKWLVRPTATTFAFSFVFILLLLGHNATTHKYSFLYMYI